MSYWAEEELEDMLEDAVNEVLENMLEDDVNEAALDD